jgi:hypothetical protein
MKTSSTNVGRFSQPPAWSTLTRDQSHLGDDGCVSGSTFSTDKSFTRTQNGLAFISSLDDFLASPPKLSRGSFSEIVRRAKLPRPTSHVSPHTWAYDNAQVKLISPTAPHKTRSTVYAKDIPVRDAPGLQHYLRENLKLLSSAPSRKVYSGARRLAQRFSTQRRANSRREKQRTYHLDQLNQRFIMPSRGDRQTFYRVGKFSCRDQYDGLYFRRTRPFTDQMFHALHQRFTSSDPAYEAANRHADPVPDLVLESTLPKTPPRSWASGFLLTLRLTLALLQKALLMMLKLQLLRSIRRLLSCSILVARPLLKLLQFSLPR